MKKAIRTVTAFILTMTSFFPGICHGQSDQGNISAAEQMVQSSHNLVRDNARQVMNTYLVSEMQSLLEARGLVQTAKQVRQYIGNKASESDILLKETTRTASLDMDFIRQLNDDSLENLYLSFREKTNHLNLLNYQLETALLGLMETKESTIALPKLWKLVLRIFALGVLPLTPRLKCYQSNWLQLSHMTFTFSKLLTRNSMSTYRHQMG